MPLIPAGKVYEQGAADGILMISASQYTSNTAGSGSGAGKTWDEIDAATYAGDNVAAGELAGAIEPVIMRALPNTGTTITDAATQLTDSPRLGYRSLIRVGGSFNFAARMYRTQGGDQQMQVGEGLNNPLVLSIPAPDDRFAWDSDFTVGAVVLPPGVHDIGAWMRHDGAIFDRIVLWPEGTTFDPDTQGDTYPLSALVDEPTLGVPGTYTSIPADGELLQTFDSVLSASAVPGVFPDHQGRIMNNANGAFSWTSDGEIIYNFPGEGIAFYSAFDPTQGIWVTQAPLTLTNAAPLASLTITTEDSQPGDTILAETDYDLTGFNNSDLCLSLAGIEIPLVITQTNPGRVSAVFPETKQGGILLADQIDITLNVCNVGALTVADQANLKPRGALFTPATAANLADYPQAQQLNDEGVPVFAAQLEDHDDGTYSVLVNGAWEFYETVDTEAPVINTPIPDASYPPGTPFTLPTDITDAIDPTLDYTMTVNGVAVPTLGFTLDPLTGEGAHDGSTLPVGIYTVDITAEDDAGNSVTDQVVIEITDPADTDPPVFTTSIDSENIDEGDPAGTISGHVVTDATLPIVYSAELDSVAMPTGGWSVDTSTGDISYPAGLTPGTYTYVLTATDSAVTPNSTTSTGVLVVTADTSAPVFTTPAQDATIGVGGGTVSGHVVTDANTPIVYTATVDGVAMPTAGWSIDLDTGEVTVPAGLAPGDYDYVITATDSSAGMNMGTSAAVVTVPDVSAPVFTTPVSNATDNTGNAGAITGHVVTDDSAPITYTATVDGVPMPTAGWTVDPSTGDISYPAGLSPGQYEFVLTASDAATPTNSSTSAGTLTIPAASIAAPNHAIFPISFVPEQNSSFVDVVALGPFALPGLPANVQVDYDNQNGDLVIFPDGSYDYAGSAPLTFDVEASDGDGTWDAVSVTVHPALDLATPEWVPPATTPLNSPLLIDAADVFNIALAEPNAQVTFVGFPGASSATGNQLAVDTSALGVHDVAIRATINGHDYVTQYFTLTIVGEELVDFSAAWAIQARTLAETSFSWTIDSRTLVSFLPTWLLDGRETVTFTPDWAIDARTLVETPFSWLLDARALAEFSASWLLDSRTLVGLSTAWVIGQTLTPAESTFSWLLDARETVGFTPNWELSSTLTETEVAYTWLVTGTTLFIDAPSTWRIGVPLTETGFITDWLINGPVELCFSASWRVLARSSFTQDRAFHILD